MSSISLTACYSVPVKERDEHREELKRRFAAWFRRELDRRELEQAEFARKAGIKPGLISRYYNAKTLPTSGSAIKIADALEVGRDFVLDLAGHRPLEETPIDLSDPLLSFFTSHANELTLEEKRAIIEIARTMIRK